MRLKISSNLHDEVGSMNTGLGIENMKMRAKKLKGELHILATQEGFLVQLRMQAL